MGMSPDSSLLALCGEAGQDIHIFDLWSGRLHADLKRTAGWRVECVSFRSDSKQVAFGGRWDGGSIRMRQLLVEVWDLGSGTRVWESQDREWNTGVRVAFSPQNNLVACSAAYKCRLLDVISGKTVVEWSLRSNRSRSLAWATDESRLLTCDDEDTVFIWDVASARALRSTLSFPHDIPDDVLVLR